MSKLFKFDKLGLEVEVGKVALQADGAVWIKHGNNVVLSTVVASREERDFMGFFPLTVEYREKTSAAGRIPGGYIKREGRLSDAEVLASRLVDRPIRPLFPKYYFNEVQIISSVYSYDGKYPQDILALIASSLALTISPIPFFGPIGGVRVGRIGGEFKFNLSREELLLSDIDMVVAGTKDGICMVEGFSNSISENDLVEILFFAHEEIIKQIDWQLEIQKEIGVKKEEIKGENFWKEWESKVRASFKKDSCERLFGKTKAERTEASAKLEEEVLSHFTSDIEAKVISKSQILFLYDLLLKEYLPDVIAKRGSRFDGRPLNKVRDVSAEVAILPSVHGSSLFNRGETQALSSLTLGTAQDAQRVEDLEGESSRTFMLHYNFPPFATGEVKPMRGVSRRDIGHGYLAERSFNYVVPSQEEFPYTIRSVVDILGSNGSSSMATVCATSLALMDAGVPIKDAVGGIAMGLMKDSSGKFHILTDILGAEDALGLMDFKVTGTSKGIMAVQMDVKDKAGLTKEVLKEALSHANKARLFILESMKGVLEAPRKDLSELAPRVSSFRIDTDKIGLVIGPGGKSIKEIIAATNTQIDINDDGLVRVYSQKADEAKAAERWIKTLVGDIEVGMTVDGKIRKIAEFGIFVELVPGKDGLVHISAIAKDKQSTLSREYKVGDVLKVKVIAVEAETGRIRLIAPDLK